MPCASSAGSECKNPSRPLPASNFFSVLNSSLMFLSHNVHHGDKRMVLEQDSVTFVSSVRNHFSSASFALIFSKFGNSRASSVLSAY